MEASPNSEEPSASRHAAKSQSYGLTDLAATSATFEVKVLFTTHRGTLAALRRAASLGKDLGVRPVVLLMYAVPYTLPLVWSGVSREFLSGRIHALEAESPVPFNIQVCFCRSFSASLRRLLPPQSLILMGGKKGWWSSDEQRLARRLNRDGHEVLFVDVDKSE